MPGFSRQAHLQSDKSIHKGKTLTDKRSHIMVVDDDLFFRELIRDNLSEEFDITAVESGKEAIKLAKKMSPDLILLDRLMPDMSGEGVCKKLKSDDSTMAIPIIMVTSLGEKDEIIEGLEAGADYYIAKPVYMPELIAKIRSSLRTQNIYLNFEKKDLLNVLDIYESLTVFQTSKDILSDIAHKVAVALDAVRCSIVKVDDNRDLGLIIASNEDVQTQGVQIDLKKYPEIRRSIDLKRDVIINDIHSNPMLKEGAEFIKDLPFSSLAVLPISIDDKFMGTLLLRVATEKEKISEKEISFCEVVARAAGNVLENATLMESLRLANIELETLATTDGLTGLYNHRFFYLRLDEEYNISMRYEVTLACIMLDIDFFKNVNDTYGHRVGDIILKEMASIITKTIRKTDIAARYGGEEFVILLPHTDREGAMLEAERIREAIGESSYSALPKGESITISLGISTCLHDAVCKPEDLVKFADKALYMAKEGGRNRAIMWNDS